LPGKASTVREKESLMIVGNFSPDPIEWMHIGIVGTIEPGETVDMDEGRARHILNKFARRGLVQMVFGDEVEVKKKDSMALWMNFWEQQITSFNQHNEDQKEKGNRYARPPKELIEKAKTLGLELLQPWRIEKTDDKIVKALQAENVELKATVETQSGQIAQILDMLKAGKVDEPAPERVTEPDKEPDKAPDPEAILDVLVAENRKKYSSLTIKTMAGWLKNNWEELLVMPEENRFEIETRYLELYQTPFPTEKPT